MSVVDAHIGSELGGYRIERLLGRGGMSSVYLAEHLRLHRRVALKLLAPELAGGERFRERFLRESQLAASLDHPNIVPIYDADEADGVLYIAMRYVEGADLRELVRLESPLAPARALAIVGQAAAGLDAAHRRGLVHRDVKPGNILVGEDDHVYVSDFGLTKQASSQTGLTATGQLVGTLDYVAPEQIQGKPVDGRTDEYSLACVLYECLAGARPFERDTEVAVLWAHMQDPPPRLSERRPDLPRSADAALAKGMAKNPDDRYAGCRELVDAVRRDLGISSGEIPQPVATRRPRVDRRLFAAAATVLAATLVAVVLLSRGGAAVGPLRLNMVGAIDPKTNKLVAAIPAGRGPIAIAVGERSVWVANRDDGTVTRIDAKSRKVVNTIGGISGTPISIAVGRGSVWVTTLEGRLFRIDPAADASEEVPLRGVQRRVPGGAYAGLNTVVANDSAVWLFSLDLSEILRLDPSSGRVVAIEDGRGPSAIALGSRALWVSELATVSRIDTTTNVVSDPAQIGALGNNPYSLIAVGEGSVWVAKPGEVWQVSPVARTAVGETSVRGAPQAVAAGEGAVWVSLPYAGTLVRIDPRTRAVTKRIRLESVSAVATGSGLVWVTTVSPTAR